MKNKFAGTKNWLKGVGLKLSKYLWCNKLHPTSFKIIHKFALLGLIITLISFPYIYEQYSIYDFQKRYKEAIAGSFIKTGNMNLPRSNHSSIKLNDGNVLIVGGNRGAEILNIKTGKYILIDKNLPEYSGSQLNSILLPNGNVLIAGYYIFNSNTYKIYPVNNAERYIPQKILTYRSYTGTLTPVVLSDKKVLVIIEYPNLNKVDNRFLLYDIEKNNYEPFNINIDDSVKKHISHRTLYIKDTSNEVIYFVCTNQTGVWIIKWNYAKNKITDVKNCSTQNWSQSFILDKNIILNNINKTAILDIDTGVIQEIEKLGKTIYTVFNISDKNYIFTSDYPDKHGRECNIHISYLYQNKFNDYDIPYIKDTFKFNLKSFENFQSIVYLDNGFLLSGGQLGVYLHARTKNSIIIKL